MGFRKESQCHVCGYIARSGHLRRHFTSCHDEPFPEKRRIGRTAVCDKCHKTFAYAGLARHKRLMHNIQAGPENRSGSMAAEATTLEDTPSNDNLKFREIARVDAAILEIENFLQSDRINDGNQELRRKYEIMLPVLRDNLEGKWKALDTFSTLPKPSKSHMRVLETTNGELTSFCDGNDLPQDVGCIVVRNDLSIPPHRARLVKQQMATFHEEDGVEGQNNGRGNSPTTSYGLLDHLARHKLRAQNPNSCDLNAGNDTPRNLLSLSGKLAVSIPEPASVTLLAYSLLSTLTLEIQAHYGRRKSSLQNVAGKEHVDLPWLSDLASCLRFCLFGDRLSLSLPHLDVLNGTWVTCLSGCKLWFVYEGPWEEKQQAEFRNEGQDWMPVGFLKLVLLRPGDTLIMRPGYPIVHAVLTLEDSIMVGGMIWPESGLKALAESMTYIAKNFPTTNEHVPRQLPEFIDAIIRLVNDPRPFPALDTLRPNITRGDLEAIQAFKEQLHSALACRCPDGECDSKCPCRKGNKQRVAGCSAWCHPDYDGFELASARCKPISCNCGKKCTGKCNCKKRQLKCSDRCHNSKGKTTCGNL